MAERYYASQRHTIQVDYVTFMDEIAELAGCKPNLCEQNELGITIAYLCCFASNVGS